MGSARRGKTRRTHTDRIADSGQDSLESRFRKKTRRTMEWAHQHAGVNAPLPMCKKITPVGSLCFFVQGTGGRPRAASGAWGRQSSTFAAPKAAGSAASLAWPARMRSTADAPLANSAPIHARLQSLPRPWPALRSAPTTSASTITLCRVCLAGSCSFTERTESNRGRRLRLEVGLRRSRTRHLEQMQHQAMHGGDHIEASAILA